jgi:glycine/D-amino acid oxidase-like deaminating enzyme
MQRAGSEIRVGLEVLAVQPDDDGAGLRIECRRSDSAERVTYAARFAFVCAYSQLNRVLHRSGLEPIPLKHEVVEISLIEPPPELAHYGVTVMDGPFFGTMPFPARGLHSLYHVRYAPHYAWHEGPAPIGVPPASELEVIDRQVTDKMRTSRYSHAIRDAQRYLPVLGQARLRDSLWEIRTVMPRSETDDSRPILFRRHHGLRNLFCVAGAKIDNVFDLLDEVAAIDLS